MDITNIHNIFFLGIGGIGMSALARYFHAKGVKVSGYDKTPTALTNALQHQGIEVIFKDEPAMLPSESQLVIYTPAMPSDTKLFGAIQTRGIPMLKRANVLGIISQNTPTIAIAGTHGKTTISTMVAHIMQTAGIKFSAFLGGISTDYKTNFIGSNNPQWMVVEADEFDRSFLQLSPDIAVISSMDSDHLDIYGSAESMVESFGMFSRRLHPNGTLILRDGLQPPDMHPGKTKRYHLTNPVDYYTEDIRIENNSYMATIRGEVAIDNLQPGLPGRHNLENALAAIAVAHCLGISKEVIKKALNSFSGVKRRFEKVFQDNKRVYIDDYAHHPEELRACICAAKELYPGKKITGIFQPHLFSRTRDLAEGFAQSLALLDNLILMEIYPAREIPIEGINSAWLLEKIQMPNKRLASKDEILEIIAEEPVEVLLTMGAGNIDLLTEPLKNIMERAKK